MSGHVAIAALISPYRADRQRARAIVTAGGCAFIEIFVDAPLAVCEQRDPKGLYRRARAGELSQMTGIDAPYEAPEMPEIHVRTAESRVEDCTATILDYILPRVKIPTQAD
jgi:bifunctional enzyme CysN/CysC